MEDVQNEWRIRPEDWPDAIALTDGPQVVVGGPGAGKTEFLVRRVVHLIDQRGIPPGAVLVLSFGRRGVADIRERVRTRLDRSVAEVDVSTFHSYAARLIEAHGPSIGWSSPPQILTGPEQAALVRDLLADENRGAWSAAFGGLLGTTTFAGEIRDFLLRASEQLVTDDELSELAAGRADWRGLPEFRHRYRSALRAAGRIDYGELLSEAVAVARMHPDAVPRYVLVDEFQDTTLSQAVLVEELTAAHGNLTVAGDPYQSIYSFRGAVLENIAEFPDRHRDPAGLPARRIVLTTSFRCPEAILESAVRVTERDLPGSAGRVTPASSGGSVVVHRFDQQTAEAEWIASEIERIHLVDGVPLGRIGVLVRSKRRFLPEMSRSLERRRIAHDPPESRLAEQPAVRFVLDATAVAAGADVPSELDRAVRRILLGPLFRVSLGRLRDIERARAVDEIPWSQAIRALVPEGDALADLLDEPRWAAEWPVRRGFWHLWSSLPQIAELVSGTGRRRELRSWSSLAQVIDRWGERNPSVTLVDYRTLLDQEEFEARPLLSYTRPDEDRVTLTTLHQAKGLEFDVVFIADAVEGVFPDLRRRDSLLGVRHILRHDDLDTAGYLRFRLQEERRLAYTAMTRATKRVVWTATASGAEEGRGMPSRFLPLVAGAESLDGAITPVDTEARPVSRREAESHLRRILTDPARSAPERMAAASALANGPRWGLRETSTFHGVRRRGDDGGLVDAATLRLSPSQAESYERCPRRYALERRLKIGDATSIYAEFGTLVHDVLEAAEHAAFERGEPRSSLDEALGLLADRFDHATFGGPPFSHAWHARGVDLLRRLYDVWPEGGHVVALERELHLRIADVPWVGYADRIEETSGRIKIVDYKTTRNPPTLEQAARSIQLGFYLAAAAADPDVTSHGTPVAAEMWYPAKESRSLTTRSFDTARAGDVMATMVAITEGIRDERFDPVVSEECDRCPVRQVCPKWPQGGEDFS